MTSQQLGREERKSQREKKYGVRDQDLGSSLNLGPFLMVLFIRMPYYLGDLKRDPNSENYPFRG